MLRKVLVLLIVVAAGVALVAVKDRQHDASFYNCTTPQRNDSPASMTVGDEIDTARLDVIVSMEGALAMDFHPGSGTMYVATKQGTVESVVSGATSVAIDLRDEVAKTWEQGLLGLAFHPNGEYVYVDYTDTQGDTRVVEFPVNADGSIVGDSRREVFSADQPMGTHNGGHLAFGPDGYLWISLGDGGGEIGGPETGVSENAQDLGSVHGSLLRIDPRPSGDAAYSIPADNPYVGVTGAREEIWMIGFRNPWRFSFDSENGDLWVGDVGQFCWEEINYFPTAEGRGPAANSGWPIVEGPAEWRGGDTEGVTWAALDLGHAQGDKSVVGGVVYRGDDFPELRGWYIFTDAYVGNMRAMKITDTGVVMVRSFTVDRSFAVSFTEGPDGEIYVMSFGEGVSKLVPAAPFG